MNETMLERAGRMRVLIVAAVFLILPGCDGPTDSADAAGLSFGDEPEIILGLDGSPGGTFFRVSDISQTKAGHILVADRGNHQIAVFLPDGTPMFRRGSRGGAPQEFQALASVGEWDDQTLYTFDAFAQRVAFWSLNGEYIRSVNLWQDARAQTTRRAGDGFAVVLAQPVAMPRRIGDRTADTALVVLFDSVGGEQRTLIRAPFRQQAAIPSPEGRTRVTQLPFDAQGIVALGKEAAYYLWNADSLVLRFSYDGSGSDSIWIPIPTRPLTRDVVAAYAVERAGAVPAADRPQLMRYLSDLPYSATVPRFDRALEDGEEILWVREYLLPVDTVATWWLIPRAGGKPKRMEVPSGFEPYYVSSSKALGLMRDEFDRELVAVFGISRQS